MASSIDCGDARREDLITVRDGLVEFMQSPAGRVMRTRRGYSSHWNDIQGMYIATVTILAVVEANAVLREANGPGRDSGGGEQASSGLPDAAQS